MPAMISRLPSYQYVDLPDRLSVKRTYSCTRLCCREGWLGFYVSAADCDARMSNEQETLARTIGRVFPSLIYNRMSKHKVSVRDSGVWDQINKSWKPQVPHRGPQIRLLCNPSRALQVVSSGDAPPHHFAKAGLVNPLSGLTNFLLVEQG